MEKNGGIQAARAIAALTVAYFHSYIAIRSFPESAQLSIPLLKQYGFLGVNLFFAISGYVICLVVEKDSFALRSFAIKRFFRLYPMYWIVMAAFAGCLLLTKQNIPANFWYSLTLLPQAGAPAYDISWTLEREIVFYALAALTIPLAGTAGLALLLATLAYAGLRFGNPWSFHLISTMQAEFLVGVLVYSSKARLSPTLACLSTIIGTAILWDTRTHDFAFSTTFSIALILLGLVNLPVRWDHWSTSWLVRLGDASYSIYLTHLLMFMISAYVAARLPALPNWLCEPWRFATIGACCAVSCLTWQHIERWFIACGHTVAAPRKPEPHLEDRVRSHHHAA